MCGIAGVINYEKYDLNRVKQSLLHRGPDDQSIYYYKNVALVHTRLSIQEIGRGMQPMHFGQYTIIFNGEIYNHKELRKYLTEFTFSTHSDTETLLYLYVKYQYKMFDFLDGMYAFAIIDRAKNNLLLARDRSGKKPLYYTKIGNDFIFASELNAIKAIVKLDINETAISSFLRNGYFANSITPYMSVEELSAGCYLTIDISTLRSELSTYFDILAYYKQPKTKLSLAEATDKIDSLLIKSVSDRLLSSDVEVGAFLSGGIDSNLIVAIAAGIKPELKTFTVKFSGADDESSLARLTAARYGTNHVEVEVDITGQLVDDVDLARRVEQHVRAKEAHRAVRLLE